MDYIIKIEFYIFGFNEIIIMDLFNEVTKIDPDTDKLNYIIDNINNNDNSENIYIHTEDSILTLLFKYYGPNSKCDNNIIKKFVQKDYPKKYGITTLHTAFKYYSILPHSDSEILLLLIDFAFNTKITSDENTILMTSFLTYGNRPNCDPKVFMKLLDMDCNPSHRNLFNENALTLAFYNYALNPDCNSEVFLKLLDMDCGIDNLCRDEEHSAFLEEKYYIDERVYFKLLSLNSDFDYIENIYEQIFSFWYPKNKYANPEIILQFIDLYCDSNEIMNNLNIIFFHINNYLCHLNSDSRVMLKIIDKLEQMKNFKYRISSIIIDIITFYHSINPNHDNNILIRLLDIYLRDPKNIKDKTTNSQIINYLCYYSNSIDIFRMVFKLEYDKYYYHENGCNLLSNACIFTNYEILNHIIDSTYSTIEFRNKGNKYYPIDYLIHRIMNDHKIEYHKTIINKDHIKNGVDMYYLLKLLKLLKDNKYNYEQYCNSDSKEIIRLLLDVKMKMDIVVNDLLFSPPNNIYLGGVEYHKTKTHFYDELDKCD
jgi:hypothetical protein